MNKSGLQRWLQDYCEGIAQVVAGLAVTTRDNHVTPRAAWPPDGRLTEQLLGTAQSAIRRDMPVLVVPALATGAIQFNRVIAVPLRVDRQIVGALALAVLTEGSAEADQLLKDLVDASANVSLSDDVAGSASRSGYAPALLQLVDSFSRQRGLRDSAWAVVTELLPVLGANRAALGVLQGSALQVIAISGISFFKPEQDLVRLMTAAMYEAGDQGVLVVYPSRPTDRVRLTLAHATLHQLSAMPVASVPLIHQQRLVGVLTVEWQGVASAPAVALPVLESLGQTLAPLVDLTERAERTWAQRCMDTARRYRARLTAARDPVPKLLVGTVVFVFLLLTLLPLDYRIGAPARVEGAEQRVVAAAMDGYLHRTFVKPGDTVRAGMLLVELANQDLLLEERKWASALAQHENAYAAALARSDRTQFVIAQGRAIEADAQLKLVQQQLARTRLVAPIDGTVIKGDLGQMLGAPVQKGDVLLTIAPTERYRLIVEVDERDIAEIAVGQRGQLALTSAPSEKLPLAVTRVTPVAVVRDGRNTFEIEATASPAGTPLRPGLQGIAKIVVGERSGAWIVGHRAWDWLRLTLWSWGI